MESTTYDPRTDAGARAGTGPRVYGAPDPRASRLAAGRDGRSIGVLFADLWRQTTTLVHEEAELAKADLSEKVSEVTTGASSIASGGAVLFAGFVILLIAASNGLAMWLPPDLAPWLAPLIVAAIVMVIGYAMVAGGRRKLHAQNLKPSRSMESLRRDGGIVKEHLS